MTKIKYKIQKKDFDIIEFTLKIAVLFCTFNGTEIFGISLNKICLIPLYIALILKLLYNRRSLQINKDNTWMYFVLFAALSSLVALTNDPLKYYDDYDKKSIYFFIQCTFIYIPMMFLFCSCCEKNKLKKYLINSIILAARIQFIFSVIQVISWFIFSFDVGEWLSDLLYPVVTVSSTENWSCLYPQGNVILCRPTGFNSDPNFYTIVILLGMVLEKKIYIRLMYVVMILLSGTRSGIVVVLLLCLIKIISRVRTKRIKAKKIIKITAIISFCVIVFMTVYSSNSSFQNIVDEQAGVMISRFDIADITNMSLSTKRHILYYPYGLNIYIEDLNIIQKLIGAGPRTSGSIMQNDTNIAMELRLNYDFTWSLECDVIELLLGYGIIGFCLYYINIIKMLQKEKIYKDIFLVILFDGIMYGISSTTIVNLIFMIFGCIGKDTETEMLEEDI